MKKLILTSIICFIAGICFSATPLKMAWNDSNPNGTVSKYQVLVGKSPGIYTKTNEFTQIASTVTNTIPNVFVGFTNYLVVVAIDSGGYQSDFSNEISKYMLVAPTIRDIMNVVAGIQSSSTPNGPWKTQAEIQTSIQKQISNGTEFYRSYLTIN